MTFRPWLAAALLLTLGCAGPSVVPTSQSASFRLTDLKSQRIAIFPVASGDLDESTSRTAIDDYKSKDAFLDAFSTSFSARLAGACLPGSLDSGKVLALLDRTPATRSLLDPGKVLGTQDPNNRFAQGPAREELTTLKQLPELKDIRYLVIARDLGIGRQWSTSSTAGGGFVSTGPGGGTFVGGSSSSAKTSARLRLAVVDLDTKAVVWDGAVFAGASSTFMKASALHEVQEGLTVNFVNAVLGIR